MHSYKGQIAIEQMILTVFVLGTVSIIFAYALVSFEQSGRAAEANDAVNRMVAKANSIHALGKSHSDFIQVSFPTGSQSVFLLHKCVSDSSIGAACPLGDSDIDFSYLLLTVEIGGSTQEIARHSNAVLLLQEFPSGSELGGSRQTIRVSWTDTGKIKLRRV